MLRKSFNLAVSLVLLTACAAKPLIPEGRSVMISKEPAPAGCEFAGEVQGHQGNFWTAEFTSDANLINGARNELRNAANSISANYVKIETESFSDNTSDDSLGGTHSVVIIGNAYRCSVESLVGR
jgi:hypothetical protein